MKVVWERDDLAGGKIIRNSSSVYMIGSMNDGKGKGSYYVLIRVHDGMIMKNLFEGDYTHERFAEFLTKNDLKPD